ncbi:copper-translocating P-type ATPase [Roseivivax marinus]|uniref:Copper-translocating P-type ATPase n=1 Tax=Roseivivax marinus TaxID=1379903 RepID=W4HJM7_9RHOB|nr:heavy metal translocating P-type ATPase [Roseivivax marinus]ETW12909.1 copper-translocating P-type ATPase [Roseivivax marinus]
MSGACACGGLTAEMPGASAPAADARPDIALHLPTIHCAACIATAERTLADVPGVISARVNMGLKRALIVTDGSVAADALCARLEAAGLPAQPLDLARLGKPGDAEMRALLMRLGIAGFAMMNVMLLSVAVWSGAADATRSLFQLLSAAISVPAIAYSARPFFAGAVRSLRAGRLSMDVPIALAIALATLMSLAEALWGAGHAWFEAALSLTFFLLAGRALDLATRRAARSAAAELAALDVGTATRLGSDGPETVPSAELRVGDRVRVLPGQRLPADGRIVEGETDLDRSALTGETAPVAAAPGDDVAAGETNLTGALVVEVTSAGQDTRLARLTALVAVAESARSRYTSLADRAGGVYAPVVHILAAVAFVAWWWIAGDAWHALAIAIAVLIITCPCALGLAVPAVSVAASGRLFRRGLLLTSSTALERLAEVDTVVFDKTGTLTTGTPRIADAPDGPELAIARALAEGSGHPAAGALVRHARAAGVEAATVSDRREVPGRGVEGTWRGQTVRLGRAAWAGGEDDGRSAMWLRIGTETPLRFGLEETLRPGAAEAVAALRAAGCDVALLSGDGRLAVEDVAARTGIAEAEAGLAPEDKLARLEALAAEGRRVLMVGDGLNDTAALSAAHAAIAPGSGLDAARSAADAVLMAEDLSVVAEAVSIARRARTRMRQNLWLAAAYNAIAIPVALVGAATPLIAALAMSTSSVTVSLNAMRLGR